MKKRLDRPGYKVGKKRADGTVQRYWNPQRAVKGAPSYLDNRPFDDALTDDQVANLCRDYTEELECDLASMDKTLRFDGTIESLVHLYKTTKTSTYKSLKYSTRTRDYDPALKIISETVGARRVDALKASDFRNWFENWKRTRGHRTAHSCIRKLRSALSFGTGERLHGCAQVRGILALERFSPPPARAYMLTYDQAIAIVDIALELHRPSIALTQALQWDTGIRRIDFIGEWEPIEEGDFGGIVYRGKRWHGPKVSVISSKMILSIKSSKNDKAQVHDLNESPLVQKVLKKMTLPEMGPLIMSERTSLPYFSLRYAQEWRELADKCGIPKEIRSSDTRAGALTDAHAATGSAEDTRDYATHSDIKVTKAYIRDDGLEQNRKVAMARNQNRLIDTKGAN